MLSSRGGGAAWWSLQGGSGRCGQESRDRETGAGCCGTRNEVMPGQSPMCIREGRCRTVPQSDGKNQKRGRKGRKTRLAAGWMVSGRGVRAQEARQPACPAETSGDSSSSRRESGATPARLQEDRRRGSWGARLGRPPCGAAHLAQRDTGDSALTGSHGPTSRVLGVDCSYDWPPCPGLARLWSLRHLSLPFLSMKARTTPASRPRLRRG